MATAVAKEIMTATGLTAEKGESAQDFLNRLIDGVDKLADDAFKSLSGAGQKWADTAMTAVENKKDIPEPTGLAAAMKASVPKEDKAADKKAASKANGKSAPKKDAAKGKTKAAPKKGKGGRARLSDDAKVHWKKKDLPEGHRNKYQKDVKEGMKLADVRKNKKLFRAVKFWRRKGFVELVGAA